MLAKIGSPNLVLQAASSGRRTGAPKGSGMATKAPSRATDVPLNELAAGVRALTRSSDPGYEEARSVYNGAVDRRPAAVVRCADVADVIACTNFARDHGMALAIRGGAHHGGGFCVWDDALVIDLGGLRSTTVSPAAQTVRVDGGCTWGDVDHATGAFGMATPAGFISTTGVGGQTLGGGFG
jgi:FAD/FMN-containing dehydrogenase